MVIFKQTFLKCFTSQYKNSANFSLIEISTSFIRYTLS